MKLPKIKLATYQLWAKDLRRLRTPPPTEAEQADAIRVNLLDGRPTPDGCVLRIIAMSGGSIDLMLNAAQAIHLFRTLARNGMDGGWMDATGRPLTEPLAKDDLQSIARPQDLAT